MRRPSSEPWAFGGAWRPRVECRRGLHMDGGGAMALGCCAAGAIRFPTRNPNPSDFPISFTRNPVRNPMTSPPMRIQYAPSPAPMKVSSPNTIPSTKPINQTTPSFILVISRRPVASRARTARRGRGIRVLQVDYRIWDGTPRPKRMALRRRRRALSSRPLLAALHPIVLKRMRERQADPIGAWADPVRLHRRALWRRVLRRARRPRDVLDLILRHVRGEVWDVPEDAEDLLVPQADVMEECDDRETAHVRDVLVVLDLREQVVHARREPRDADLPDVLRLERRLLRLQK